MAEDNFDEEFERAHEAIKKLEARIEALEHPKELAAQQIVLTAPDGGFRVTIRLGRFQLSATPAVLNAKGEWVEGTAVGVNARWQLQDGKLIHFGSRERNEAALFGTILLALTSGLLIRWSHLSVGTTRNAEFSSRGAAPTPRWRDLFAITGQPGNRTLSRAREKSRAAQGPSPSILSLTGRGEEGPGILRFALE
jgi:hypothetical protein